MKDILGNIHFEGIKTLFFRGIETLEEFIYLTIPCHSQK